ncbi:MAG TPA: TetR/AcrR family transcriptional regulator [Streptosporangiaceae bacterium]|jgi:AcrR family transcriptional regulator
MVGRLASARRSASPPRARAVEGFLDAAERLLIEEGHAGVTTRRLAGAAGLNQGLIHYYFGSLDEVMLQALERFTDRLIKRQRALYEADKPFIEKWRTAMRYLEEDLAAGYPKIWLELQAFGWNRPEIRERIARVNQEWREVLTDAFGNAADEYGLDPREFPLEALVSLVMTFNQGIELERVSGVSAGHDALLAWIDQWLESQGETNEHDHHHAARRGGQT